MFGPVPYGLGQRRLALFSRGSKHYCRIHAFIDLVKLSTFSVDNGGYNFGRVPYQIRRALARETALVLAELHFTSVGAHS